MVSTLEAPPIFVALECLVLVVRCVRGPSMDGQLRQRRSTQFPEEDCSGKPGAMRIVICSSNASPQTGAGHITEEGYVSDFHSGMVREPIASNPSVSRQIMEQVENIYQLGTSRKPHPSQKRFNKRRMTEDRFVVHPLWREESCSGRQRQGRQ